MHRSNFRPKSAGTPDMQNYVPPPPPAINYVVAQNKKLETAIDACTERMEEMFSRVCDAVITLNQKLDARCGALAEQIVNNSDGLSSLVQEQVAACKHELDSKATACESGLLRQLHEVKTGLQAVNGVIKASLAEMAREIDPKSGFDAVKGELKALAKLDSGQKKNTAAIMKVATHLASLSKLDSEQKKGNSAIAKVATHLSVAQKVAKNSSDSITKLVGALSERLDDVLSSKDATASVESVDLSGVIEYFRAEKQIIRDSSGDIVGWKVKSH
jgi:hypothetical protein